MASGTVLVQPIDGDGRADGDAFTVPILDDAGRYTVELDTSGLVVVSATGVFWDEVADAPFAADLTLSAVGRIDREVSALNINLVTRLTTGRVLRLLSDGQRLDAAQDQAENELYAGLGLGTGGRDGAPATSASLFDDNVGNSWVFLVGATFLAAANKTPDPPGTLLRLIDSVERGLADTGTVSGGIHDELAEAEFRLNTAPTELSLLTRFVDLGLDVDIPDLDVVADQDRDARPNSVDVCRFIPDLEPGDRDLDGVPDACDPTWTLASGNERVLCGAALDPPYVYCTEPDEVIDETWRRKTYTPEPPTGVQARAIIAGGTAACIVSVDDEAVCRFMPGGDVITVATDVVEVSIGSSTLNNLVCALKTDGTMVCQKALIDAPVPAGKWSHIAVGGDQSCGVRAEDGTIGCWRSADGLPTISLDPLPTGAYVGLQGDTRTGDDFCALDGQGRLACFGSDIGDSDVPSGEGFVEVKVDGLHACARRTDNSVTCWSYNTACAGLDDAPEPLQSIGLADCRSCGITLDGRRICWN